MTQGRNAVVTGSTSGIGLGIAKALAAAGMNVMLNGFGDADQIQTHRLRIAETHGVETDYSDADMTVPEEIGAMVEKTRARFGTVDVVVNNAGIQHVSPIESFPVEKWDAVLATNLSAAFHTTRATLEAMKARGWGRIVNIASAHGLGRLALQGRLRRRQARPARAHQDGRPRSGRAWSDGERHLPWLREDTPGRAPDPRHRPGARYERGAGDPRGPACCAADSSIRPRGGDRCPCGVSVLHRRRLDQRRGAFRRWRLDCPVGPVPEPLMDIGEPRPDRCLDVFVCDHRRARYTSYQKAVDLDSVAHRVRLQPRIDPRVLIHQPSGVRTNVSK